MLTTLDKMVNWARKRSMWPLGFGLACCAIEMISTFASRYDLARYGMEIMRPSPRQADLIIVSGRLSVKMAPVLKRLYDDYGITSIIVESGPTLSTELLRGGFIDKFLFFIAPRIIGGDSDYSMFSELDLKDIGSSRRLDIKSVKIIGDDILVTAYPIKITEE